MAPKTDSATLTPQSEHQGFYPSIDWIDVMGLDLKLQESMAAALMVPGKPVRLLNTDNKAGRRLPLGEAVESNQSYMVRISESGKLHVLVFDLDTKGEGTGGRPRGVEIARCDKDRLVDRLETAGLDFVLCSSGSGYHVFVPLTDPVEIDDIAAGCRALERDLASLDLAPILNRNEGHIRPPLSAHAKRAGVRSLPHVHPQRALEVLVAGNPAAAVVEWLQNEASELESGDAIEPATPRPNVHRHPERPRAKAALKGEAKRLAQTTEGGRARAAYRAGARCGHWAALGALSDDEVLSELKRRPGNPPLEPDEAEKQIRAGLSDGKEHPRDWSVMPPRWAVRQDRDEWATALMDFVATQRRSALQPVARAVIELMTRSDGASLFLKCALPVRDISIRAGVGRGTCQRHLKTITQGRFLERINKKREEVAHGSGRMTEKAAIYRPTIPFPETATSTGGPVIDALNEIATSQLAESGLDSALGLLRIPGGANKTLLLEALTTTPRTVKEVQALIAEALGDGACSPPRSALSSLLASWIELGLVASEGRKVGYRWAEGVTGVSAYRLLMQRHQVEERHEWRLAIVEHERQAFSTFLLGEPKENDQSE